MTYETIGLPKQSEEEIHDHNFGDSYYDVNHDDDSDKDEDCDAEKNIISDNFDENGVRLIFQNDENTSTINKSDLYRKDIPTINWKDLPTNEPVTKESEEEEAFNYWRDYISANDFAMLNKPKVLPPDNDIQLPGNNDPTKTIGSFMRALSEFLKVHAVTKVLEAQLMTLLKDFFPILPVCFTKGGNYKPTFHLYDTEEQEFTTFDVCANDCITYTGLQSQHMICSKCNVPRYKPCTKAACVNAKVDKCIHKDRTSMKQIFYRPITPLIVHLLKQPGFLDALNYHYQKPSLDEEYSLMDIQDGTVCSTDLMEMRLNFIAEMNNRPDAGDYKPVNILLSTFQDGIKVYNYKVCKFKPLLISITNLPPNYRNHVGTGTFLITVFLGKENTPAHNLLYKCFIDELLVLEKGHSLIVDGQKYFV